MAGSALPNGGQRCGKKWFRLTGRLGGSGGDCTDVLTRATIAAHHFFFLRSSSIWGLPKTDLEKNEAVTYQMKTPAV